MELQVVLETDGAEGRARDGCCDLDAQLACASGMAVGHARLRINRGNVFYIKQLRFVRAILAETVLRTQVSSEWPNEARQNVPRVNS